MEDERREKRESQGGFNLAAHASLESLEGLQLSFVVV